MRPYIPYKIGEEVGWRGEDFQYTTGRIVAAHGDDSYDVKVLGGLIAGVASRDLRRTQEDSPQLMPGSRIIARYPGHDGWFHGELSGINSDHTYAIQFDDGDFLQQVNPRNVRPDVMYAYGDDDGGDEEDFDDEEDYY